MFLLIKVALDAQRHPCYQYIDVLAARSIAESKIRVRFMKYMAEMPILPVDVKNNLNVPT